jgi:ComF family protein
MRRITSPLSSSAALIQRWARLTPSLFNRLLHELIFSFYPPGCVACSQPVQAPGKEDFCSDCGNALELIGAPYCPLCGLPLSTAAPLPHLCGGCLSHVYLFDGARAAGIYRGLLRQLIHRFKYEGQISLARPLARLLIQPGRELMSLFGVDLVTPVPLHPRRLRQRGFNQASLLARRLGVSLNLPVHYSSMDRSRWTAPQMGLSRRQRAENVRGAFVVRDPDAVRGKVVLLVDDVLTTGETVNQCVRGLKKSEAREVLVLTVARTVAL